MNGAVFLDTSFLITLVNPAAEFHKEAAAFYKHFLKERIPMGVSSIVVGEFSLKQKWSTMPQDQFVTESFTHDDAIISAELDYAAYKNPSGPPGGRQSLKDDFKIIGHAHARGYQYLITRDRETMMKYCTDLLQAGRVKFHPVDLALGFSKSVFGAPKSSSLS
ncbi:MAG: type II toxin-antitoxin system VapC family toxin [Nibricoccus sp.]